ncbi:methyltransferase domain-containing protein [Algoriphagus aestuariicola]|jgi:phospholipid N-methyltransferase|uniref:Methyltransferase domain-containing protein n=1 Tax=Algoriphagus aestuariicola TaxID=1852016 RepID=A0ABS3BMR7_9BACT|nr:methyltransferase [Algoriphagus aestuariicola]MBN7800453.1 methyltransferase domain-containing protein [Algoriphagus aestuariicola]
MGKSDLLLELYSNLSTTGALAFSSKALVNKMLSFTDMEHAKLVVELGGGDGSITQGIIERLSPEGILLVFEINSSFCESMRKQFPQPNVRIICDSAENMDRYLAGKKADYIVSSLPFIILPKETTDEILSKSRDALSQKGKMVIMTYSFHLKRLFRRFFTHLEVKFTFRNLPPAFVMICH